MSTIINFALEEIEDAVNLLDEQEEVIKNAGYEIRHSHN